MVHPHRYGVRHRGSFLFATAEVKMATFRDVECIVGFWYQEASVDARCSLWDLECELAELASAPECRSSCKLLARILHEYQGLLREHTPDLLPEFRLAAVDMSSRKAMRPGRQEDHMRVE